MASLKDLKVRIGSVKNTQKITKAMKMVAASKLRRAREAAEASRPYAQRMERMVQSLAHSVRGSDDAPLLMVGTGKDQKHLLIVASAYRGLCGGFNASIVKATKQRIKSLQAQGKEVHLFCVGRKAYEVLRGEYQPLIVGKITEIAKKTVGYEVAERVGTQVVSMMETENYDVCSIIYNRFVSAISQEVTRQQLIPLSLPDAAEAQESDSAAQYEYEPDEETILRDLLPRNLSMQIFKALLENAASEQGARMTAMDNATRNAGDMIKKLTLQYNRSRQAAITKELIEIISGAEAV
jgi:F-type H+-transporting ATPase subunit gamma